MPLRFRIFNAGLYELILQCFSSMINSCPGIAINTLIEIYVGYKKNFIGTLLADENISDILIFVRTIIFINEE